MALNVTRPLGSVQTSDYNTWRYLPYVDLACDLDAVRSLLRSVSGASVSLARIFAPALVAWVRGGWRKEQGMCSPLLAASWAAWFVGDPGLYNRRRAAIEDAVKGSSALSRLGLEHPKQPVGRAC